MSSEDWYRNEDWNEAIEKAFYSKLKRARTQRYQYLVIQALSLSGNHPDVTLRLVEEYFEIRIDASEDVRALLAKASAYKKLNQLDNCISTYKEIIKREKASNTYQTQAYLDYPYLVATQKIESEYTEASNVLRECFEQLTFPLDYFKWHTTFAIINHDSLEAQKALDVAQIKRSGFRFHQSLGLVGKEHERAVRILRKLST
ncbi:hypothetical protein [Vibrio sp. SCSIO 43136]|uniref:hypothetical protein n=1 Tax=Vibrio sp. SCSIO 43136 TaxID=2819101 RepID=UPI0020762FE1|nr:hypothetical protein [Vibrio sp. SCSIO 43136]USD64076.1 hypothetical protein J4N39_08045 [Vibrio sp. SCSIO 43136]